MKFLIPSLILVGIVKFNAINCQSIGFGNPSLGVPYSPYTSAADGYGLGPQYSTLTSSLASHYLYKGAGVGYPGAYGAYGYPAAFGNYNQLGPFGRYPGSTGIPGDIGGFGGYDFLPNGLGVNHRHDANGYNRNSDGYDMRSVTNQQAARLAASMRGKR